jgi:hypothetical protein
MEQIHPAVLTRIGRFGIDARDQSFDGLLACWQIKYLTKRLRQRAEYRQQQLLGLGAIEHALWGETQARSFC